MFGSLVFCHFAAGTLPLIFSIETGVPKKDKFPVKDQTAPKILCSKPPIVMGNFNGNVLAQKYAKKGKRPDFQTLPLMLKMELITSRCMITSILSNITSNSTILLSALAGMKVSSGTATILDLLNALRTLWVSNIRKLGEVQFSNMTFMNLSQHYNT